MDYDQLKDALTSDTGVEAVNKIENLKIKGKKFKTNSKFDFVELEENVEIYNGDTELFGDIGKYSNLDKIMTLEKNGSFKSKDKEGNDVSGTFNRRKV